MKTPVTLQVPIKADWDAGTRLQVYSNRGSGDVDTEAPLLQHAMRVFPGQFDVGTYGEAPYDAGRYDHGPALPPCGDEVWQGYDEGPYGGQDPRVEVTVWIPAAFGKWTFAVEAIDAEGNAQSASLIEIERMVSGTEPPTLKSFGFSSYNTETDQVTFTVAANTE